MSHIFREHAPAYWGAGLPVIPLKRFNAQSKGAGKAPVIHEWQQYGTNMPSEAIREHWRTEYGSCNIGLPFGPASGLCAIDIDTIDEDQVKAIETVIPKSPWIVSARRAMARSSSGRASATSRSAMPRTTRSSSSWGWAISSSCRRQSTRIRRSPTVPTPISGKSSTKSRRLGVDIEDRLRAALGIAGFSLSHEGRSKPLDVVPSGERDIQLVRHAGYLSRVVFGIDKQAKFSLGEAIQQMYHWVQNFTASVSGDDMDPDKGVAKLLEFILKDLEGGRTLPEGWDADLTQEQLDHPTIQAIASKNQAESWTFSRARDWIGEQIAMKPTDDDWALARVNELVEKVAADENFSLFQFQSLCPTLQAVGNLGFRKTDLVKLFKDARNAHKELAADHETIAREVVEDMSRTGELRWWLGSFWQWNGSCFERVEDDDNNGPHRSECEG
jgi:putative DNA primase/helicase